MRDDAYALAKGAVLASMYMGISPGNVGTMQYLDVYRRESQRDFGDSAGTMSRAIVEGLFGVHPDALAGTLTISPGFPEEWTHARLTHPDVGVSFDAQGAGGHVGDHAGSRAIPDAHAADSRGVRGRRQRRGERCAGSMARGHRGCRAGRCLRLSTTAAGSHAGEDRLVGRGDRRAQPLAAATPGEIAGGFTRVSLGTFRWWSPAPNALDAAAAAMRSRWTGRQRGPVLHLESVDLTACFNDRVSAIFERGKYLAPRSPGVSLALPSQGAGAWAGHMNDAASDRRHRAAQGRCASMAARSRCRTGSSSRRLSAADAKNILVHLAVGQLSARGCGARERVARRTPTC